MDRLGTATVNRTTRVSEKAFMAQVIQLAKLYRWRVYHTHDSRRSVKGFPDLVLVRGPVLLFAELKTDTSKLTADQCEWLAALNGAGVVACVWRPADWNAIVKELTP